MITNRGQEEILNSLANNKRWANSIALGIGGTAATATDVSLDFLLTTVDVSNTIVVPSENKVYYKSSLESDISLAFLEIGCYGQQSSALTTDGEMIGQLLTVFDHNTVWTDTEGTVGTDDVNARASAEALSYSLAASTSAAGFMEIDLDLSTLKLNTIFKLAYYTSGMSDIILSFKNDDSNYYSANDLSVVDGYNIGSVTKSAFLETGTPDWATITQIELSATAGGAGGTFTFDALRYDSASISDQHILSRVVLPEIKTKTFGRTMDIEYALELS